MEPNIKWGIVGPGKIAHSFVADLNLVPSAQLMAVASRSGERARKFADAYGVTHAFDNYRDLFTCEEVDVVYISTPHTSHAELAITAMQHGKHVLCEKPMGVNRKEVEQMIQASKEHNVFLMEALWSRFNPAIQKVGSLIDQGTIGAIKYLHADFAFYALDHDGKGRLLNPGLAGGSLLDIGIYPVFLSYLVLGMPKEIKASSQFHTTGVEIQTSMLLTYENAQAVLYSGLTSKSEMKAEISGTDGTLYLHPRWHQAQGYSLEKNGETTHFQLPTLGKGYSHEIMEVHHCIKQQRMESNLWSHQNSLDLMEILDKIRSQTGIVFPFE
ncbi:MAG: Gfo/Idh/MocA family protein [Flavobacteriaceae bacterium]